MMVRFSQILISSIAGMDIEKNLQKLVFGNILSRDQY